MNDLEFRCLATDDCRESIEAVALELAARVRYFKGSMNVLYVMRAGEFLGYVWLAGKSLKSLREAILEVLNDN